MSDSGSVRVEIESGAGRISFFHPKGNCLPRELLGRLAECVGDLGRSDEVRVLTLSSRGRGAFCAGASFDEILQIDNEAEAREYFMGFARLILAMKRCPRFVLTRVQGKAVGGGVGIIAASDYVLALDAASFRLGEFALGFGPFVIGPALQRKIGLAAFAGACIDTEWRDPEWATSRGLYTRTYPTLEALDQAFDSLAMKLAASDPEATAALKAILWEGTEEWEELLAGRAEISGRLVLSDFTRDTIEAFKKR